MFPVCPRQQDGQQLPQEMQLLRQQGHPEWQRVAQDKRWSGGYRCVDVGVGVGEIVHCR